MTVQWIEILTPIGDLGIAASGDEIVAVRFGGAPARGPGPPVVRVAAPGQPPVEALQPEVSAVLGRAAAELHGYFAGAVTDFRVPLAAPRGSAFERAVWVALAAIPFGEMVTYGEIATALGEPGAARAVGVACNRNPVPVIVPCHRVVGAGGKLVGFGGGLDRKRFLLNLEARVRVERSFA